MKQVVEIQLGDIKQAINGHLETLITEISKLYLSMNPKEQTIPFVVKCGSSLNVKYTVRIGPNKNKEKDKSIKDDICIPISSIDPYDWHTMHDRIPIKGEKCLVQNEDGTTFEWQYGDCGLETCRCDLRDRKFKVIK